MSYVVVVLLAVLDVIGFVAVSRIASTDGLTNTLLALIGLLSLNMALLMPLAQMWFAIESDDRGVEGTRPGSPIITVVRDGPVRVGVKGGSVDVSVG